MNMIKVKGLVLSYYLSRCDKAALSKLGFSTFIEAFEGMGKAIGENPNNIRNVRDEFDPAFPNPRKGWYMRPMSPSRKKTIEFFKDYSDDQIFDIASQIMDGQDCDILTAFIAALGDSVDDSDSESASKAVLEDLGQVVQDTKKRLSEEFIPTDVRLSDAFKQAYSSYIRGRGENVEFQKTTAIVTNSGNLNIYVANQWFVIATYAVDLIKAIIRYRAYTEAIIDKYQGELTQDDGTTLDKKNIYKSLKEGSDKALPDKFRAAAKAFLETEKKAEDSIAPTVDHLYRFVSDYDWWLGGKGIERSNDFYVSPALGVLNLVNASQEFVSKLVYAYATEPELYKHLDEIADNEAVVEPSATAVFDLRTYQDIKDIPRKEGGRNLIVYGAPGTGKSRMLEDEFGKAPLTRRVVFHPEYSYFDFVGTYKPVPLYEKSETTLTTLAGVTNNLGIPHIDYRFVPGPFIQVLIESWLDPSNMHTLLIEELNRANTAAVFGEIFQLLDRNRDGSSEYLFEPSEDLRNYLYSRGIGPFIGEGVGMPSNMNIVATMNSADQGVNIIDSAFKRRWNFRYLRIDIEDAVHKNAEILYAGQKVSWGIFITAVNDKLKRLKVNEDRLIGPYFIKPSELNNKSAMDKLLLYLWDDVLRHKRDQGAFARSISCFGDLIDGFEISDVLGIKEFMKFPEPVAIEEPQPDEAETEEN